MIYIIKIGSRRRAPPTSPNFQTPSAVVVPDAAVPDVVELELELIVNVPPSLPSPPLVLDPPATTLALALGAMLVAVPLAIASTLPRQKTSE